MTKGVGYYVEITYRDGDEERNILMESATPLATLRQGDKLELDIDGKATYARVSDSATTFVMSRGRLTTQTTHLQVVPAGLFDFVF